MKMKAIIEVEFGAQKGAPENVLNAALMRGVGELRTAIVHGPLGGSTGIIANSIHIDVKKKEVL